MSDFFSANSASNLNSSPSTSNDPQAADISGVSADRANPDPDDVDTTSDTAKAAPLRLVETAFLASTASLIWLVNYYFPLGPLLRVFFPIPIALVYLRWGKRAAWMSALVSGLLLSVLMGPTRSILYVIPFGVMGVALGGLWRRKTTSWAVSISLGGLIGTFGFFFRLWLLSALVGQDLWVYITAQVTDMVEWVFVKFGWLSVPSLNTIQAIAAGMILVNNIIYLFVVHLVALLLLDRLGNPIPRPPRWVQILIDYEE
ncbi:MAG: DUF2232 domain-containing protein [Oscillatoriales cyanobacterium]|nr:MAG: DUF2232 domain-containing protein [Oscillatoriales cyanobacterium]TAH21341.1 MAG: DUF2232 domain-containing protein [Oscillatoriales cyanobacterium]